MIFKPLWSLAWPVFWPRVPSTWHTLPLLGNPSLTNLMLSPFLSCTPPPSMVRVCIWCMYRAVGSSPGCQSQDACVTAGVTTALPQAAYRPVKEVCCLVAVGRHAVSKGQNEVDAGKLLSLLLLLPFLLRFPWGQHTPRWAGVSGCIFNSCN